MQLLTTFSTNKSPYGDFELRPDQGWEMAQTFLDYTSGLLVVTTRATDKSSWKDTGLGTLQIPSKHYLIDLSKKKVLSFDEWKLYFSYKPVTMISEDGQYQCTLKRTHLAHQHIDIIQEEVVDLKQEKVIHTTESMAFNEYRRETFLEQLEQEAQAHKRRAKRDK